MRRVSIDVAMRARNGFMGISRDVIGAGNGSCSTGDRVSQEVVSGIGGNIPSVLQCKADFSDLSATGICSGYSSLKTHLFAMKKGTFESHREVE